MKVLIMLISLSFQMSAVFAEPSSEVTTNWFKLVAHYKAHMAEGDWSGALHTAETLFNIDPESSEARYYLVYATKRSGSQYPTRLGKPSTWAYCSDNDKHYIELAKQIMGHDS